jgi:uncharacterized damage-inducible protein DinB
MPKSPKQQFLEAFEREHERTMRVLRAYPDDETDFRPHERSRTAREVAWPMVLGQERLMTKALTTGFDWSKPPGAPPEAPATMSAIADAAERAHRQVVELLRNADDAKLEGSVQFFVAPKTLGDVPKMEFLWYLLFDHVHHRGQLTVYLRMVGKVPSVYGPSGDQPWT